MCNFFVHVAFSFKMAAKIDKKNIQNTLFEKKNKNIFWKRGKMENKAL